MGLAGLQFRLHAAGAGVWRIDFQQGAEKLHGYGVNCNGGYSNSGYKFEWKDEVLR